MMLNVSGFMIQSVISMLRASHQTPLLPLSINHSSTLLMGDCNQSLSWIHQQSRQGDGEEAVEKRGDG